MLIRGAALQALEPTWNTSDSIMLLSKEIILMTFSQGEKNRITVTHILMLATERSSPGGQNDPQRRRVQAADAACDAVLARVGPPRRVTAVWRADRHTNSDQAAGGEALCSTAKDELLRELIYRKSAVPRIGPQFSTFSPSVKVAILRALWVCPLLGGTYDKRPHGAPAPVP